MLRGTLVEASSTGPPGLPATMRLSSLGHTNGSCAAAATQWRLYTAHHAQQIIALPHAVMYHTQPCIKQQGFETDFASLLHNELAGVGGLQLRCALCISMLNPRR